MAAERWSLEPEGAGASPFDNVDYAGPTKAKRKRGRRGVDPSDAFLFHPRFSRTGLSHSPCDVEPRFDPAPLLPTPGSGDIETESVHTLPGPPGRNKRSTFLFTKHL